MTCRPDEKVPESYEGDRFKTSCYKCGRTMWFVKGRRKLNDKWEEDWLIDEEFFASQGLSEIFNEECSIKISGEDDEFIHSEIKRYDNEQEKFWKPYIEVQKELEK